MAEYFRGMQDCFRQHPDMYGSELEDDEDELEEELRAETSPSSPDAPHDTPTPVNGHPQSPQVVAQEHPETVENNSIHQPVNAANKSGDLASDNGTLK